MLTKKLPISIGGYAASLELYCVLQGEDTCGDNPRPTLLVIPGGGYRNVSPREAEPIALRFVTHGYNAAVLWYSVKNVRFPQQLFEAATAAAMLREHAQEWNIDPKRLIVCGFSAGGHLALSLGCFWKQTWLTDAVGKTAEDIRPNALVLGYPVVTNEPAHFHAGSFEHLLGENPSEELRRQTSLEKQVSSDTPPTFLWHTVTDQLVPWKGSLLLADALWEQGVSCEIHMFGWGPHGVSLADGTTTRPDTPEYPNRHRHNDAHLAHWIPLCMEWLKKIFETA